jgi:peptide/nickel transport system permease protein
MTSSTPGDIPAPRSRSAAPPRRHWGLTAGAVLLGVIAAAALFAPLIAQHDPYTQDLGRRLIPPIWAGGDWSHVLGTDRLGRDYLSRLLYGARISLFIGATTVGISGVIGSTLGCVAGYFGGAVDAVVSYFITVRLALPVALAALAVVSLAGCSLQVVVITLGLLLWDRFAVVARAKTMQVAQADYIAAARSIGCSPLRLLFSEILPNVASPLIVVATLETAHAILLEASLSFLGLGVQPPLPSWGLLIAEGKQFMFSNTWIIVIPGVALIVLTVAINLVGDGLQAFVANDDQR